MEPIDKGFSVVICAYNAEKRIVPTLEALATVTIPPGYTIELILVDNASKDNTSAASQMLWNQLGSPFPLRLLTENRPGKGFAVETGYDAAALSYILTVDDDNWLSPDYLTRAAALLEKDPEIGILQGHSIGVFEQEPPAWIHHENMEHYFVIGGPIGEPGYYPPNNYGVWGAGMILKKADWDYLRSKGFSFLTSKIPGKAAGEDHELAIGLLMLGRKVYYNPEMTFRHYMPADRVVWKKLQQNFDTYGYCSHYNFLYSLALEATEAKRQVTNRDIFRAFQAFFRRSVKTFTPKQLLAYWLKPQKQLYQLRIRQYFAHYRWYFRLRKKALNDVQHLQSWMIPVLEEHPGNFKWPWKTY